MKLGWSFRLVLTLVAVVALTAACSSKPKAVTAPVSTPEPAASPRDTMRDEVVEPTASPIPSEEVSEELPQDLQELNRRGYLKDVFFDTDKHELRPDAREALAENASWLQRHPTVRITVEGHCDERNTREYNLALGERRANAVRDYLVSLGITATRIATISYGEERPFALGHDESAWRLNRRGHFVITER